MEDGRCRRCKSPQKRGCPACGHRKFSRKDLSDFVEIDPERQHEDVPAPALPGYLQVVYDSHGTLGVDDVGKPTWAEIRHFLDEHEVFDLDERRLWESLWMAVTAGQLSVQARQGEARREELKQKQRK